MPLSAAPLQMEKLEATVYHLDPKSSLKWRGVTSHHHIDGHHLWIGVDHGVVLILDNRQHSLFQHLLTGLSPAAVLSLFCNNGIGDATRIYDLWQELRLLIARIAEAGFLEGIAGHHDERRSSPEKFTRLHITRRCQLRCIHCYAMSGPHIHPTTEMPCDQWRRLIDDIASAGGESVLFTGGEPLIRSDCTELIRRAKHAGLQVTLFTNGLLVGKHLTAFKDHVDLVQVSLNGPDAVTNDPIRGEGTFRAATDAVDMLIGAGVPVRIGITVMERNWTALKERFQQLVERYKGSGVTFHLGYGLCSYGRAKSINDQLDLEEIRPELDEMAASANRIQPPRITRKTVNCGYCEQLVVAPDGQVYPCHLLDGALGRIWDKPLAAWYAYLRETARQHRVDRIQGCRDCDLRNLCGGTCRVINRQETGSKWVTTCTAKERHARYRNLVRLFNENRLTAVSVID